ncbi:hypothetical protein [Phaffia rhodozyma]|uniref:Uncharacterized protein n=1 Tax=Phaffia rhodozyma TaxID=264483 RepID=A0A0F7SK24_PHARH|nr:hypothetical protein [Phaffia rhodozyma]
MTPNWLSKSTTITSSNPQASPSEAGPKLTSNQTSLTHLGFRGSSPLSSSAAFSPLTAVIDTAGRRRANFPSARQTDLTEYFRTHGSERTRNASGMKPRARTEEVNGRGKERETDWENEGIQVIGHRLSRSTTPMSGDHTARRVANSSTTTMFSMSSPSQAHLIKSSVASEWTKNGRSRLRPLSSEDEIDVKLELSPQEIAQQARQEDAGFERADKRRKRSPLAAPFKEAMTSLNEAEDKGMESVLRSRSARAERLMNDESSTTGSASILSMVSPNASKDPEKPTSRVSQSGLVTSRRTISPSSQTAHSGELNFDQPAAFRASTLHPTPICIDPSEPCPTPVPSSPLLSESLLPLLPASYPSPIQHSESLLRVFAPMGKDSAAHLRMLRRDQFAWESDQAFAKRKKELAEVEARKAEEEKAAREKVRGVWQPPSRPSKKQRASDETEKSREQPSVLITGPSKDIQGRGAREIFQEELEEEEEDAILQAITVSSTTPGSSSKHSRHHHLSPIRVVGPFRVQGAPSPKRARPASSQQTYSHTQVSENSSQTQSQPLPIGSVQGQPIVHPNKLQRSRSVINPLRDDDKFSTSSSSHSETHDESQLPAIITASRSDLGILPHFHLSPPLSNTLDTNQPISRRLSTPSMQKRSDRILVEQTPTPPRGRTSSSWHINHGPSLDSGQSSEPIVRDWTYDGFRDSDSEDGLVESSVLPERSRLLSSKKKGEIEPQSVEKLRSGDSAVQSSVPLASSMLPKRREKKLKQQHQDANLTMMSEESGIGNRFICSSVPLESSKRMARRQSFSKKGNDELDGVQNSLKTESMDRPDVIRREQDEPSHSTRFMIEKQTSRNNSLSPDKSSPLRHLPSSHLIHSSFNSTSVTQSQESRSHLFSEDDEIAVPSSQLNERLSPLRRLGSQPMRPKNKLTSLRVPRFPLQSARPGLDIPSRPPPPAVESVKTISSRKRNSSSWNFSPLIAHPLVSSQKATSRSSSPSALLFSPSSSQTPPAKRRAKTPNSQLDQPSFKDEKEPQQSSLLAHFRRTTIPNPKRLARLHGLDEELDDIQLSDEGNDEEATEMLKKENGEKNSGNLLEPEVALTEPASSSEFVIPNSQPSPKNRIVLVQRKAQRVMGRVPSPPPRNILLPRLDSKPIITRTSDSETDDQNEDENDIVPDSQFEEGKTILAGRTPYTSGGFSRMYGRAMMTGNISVKEPEGRFDRSVQEDRSSIRSNRPSMITMAEKNGSECIEEEGDTTIVPDEPPTDDDSDPNVTVVPTQYYVVDEFGSTEPVLEASSLTSLSSDSMFVDTLTRRSDESISFWKFAAPSSDDPST